MVAGNAFNLTDDCCINETIYNITTEDEFQEYRNGLPQRIIGCFITTVLIMMALLRNMAVIIVSICDENIKSQTGNILNMFLAVTDLLTALFSMPLSLLSVIYDCWPLGDTICRLHAGLTYFFTASSSFGSSVISMDRAFAVLYPFKYNAVITPKVLICIIAFIVLQNSMILVLPQIVPYIRYDKYETVCSYNLAAWNSVIGETILHGGSIICCYIPFTICLVSNILIMLQIRKSSKAMENRLFIVRLNGIDKTMEKMKNIQDLKKSTNSMMAIVCVFFLCFIPTCFTRNLKIMYDIDGFPVLDYILTLMIFASSATNPFIYGVLRKDYRNAYKNLFRHINIRTRGFF